MRGIIHFHSKYSNDSVLSMRRIAKFSQDHDLDFLILTDHNTIKGSVTLREYLGKRGLKTVVPIAGEYKTELGDIIAAFIDDEIRERTFDEFVQSVKRQHGLLFFPHPYSGHRQIDYIAQHVDFIEVFNSRKKTAMNRAASRLAHRYNKSTYCASDAHVSRDLSNAILHIDTDGGEGEASTCSGDVRIRDALLKVPIQCLTKRKTPRVNVIFSQCVKSAKTRNAYLFWHSVRSFLKLGYDVVYGIGGE